MDANGTRFHHLLGERDWGACTDGEHRPLRETWSAPPVSCGAPAPALAWDAERNELTLRPCLFEFVAAPLDQPPALAARRGAARDRYGSWYWIDEAATGLRVLSVGSGRTSLFWTAGDGLACEVPAPPPGGFAPLAPPAPPPAARLGGLAITDDQYLVVGTVEPAGLLVFDLIAGGPPRQLCWPPDVAFVPFDMAPAPGGGVWILDREHARYWALDRHLRVRADDQTRVARPEPASDFGPPRAARRPAPEFPTGITLAAASPLAGEEPIAIEALPDGRVLVLERDPASGASRVQCYRLGRPVGAPLRFDTFDLVAHDLAFVSEPDGATRLGRLAIASAGGNQTFAFALFADGDDLRVEMLLEFLPMRQFGGKGLVAAGDAAYYDFADRWIPLVAQRRPRYAAEGTLVTGALDAREPDCTWHRLLVDASVPADGAVRIRSRAANERALLAATPFQDEPALYRRSDGPERPFVRTPAGTTWGTWEVLFQAARGRYLQLEVTLAGNGRTTPRLRALRAYYPRFSYRDRYLPAVYREDTESASFVERWLANPEGLLTALEDRIATVEALFDVRSAPAEALDWLASWFDLALDPGWDEPRRRLLLRHAMDVFRWRGTVRGLQTALGLALFDCADESLFAPPTAARRRTAGIRIVERFRLQRLSAVAAGDASAPPDLGVASTARWRPTDGADALRHRWAAFVEATLPGLTSDDFPVRAPADPAAAEVWRRFAADALGRVPSAAAADEPRWQAFLARRYRRIGALCTAWGLSADAAPPTFDAVPLPERLPDEGARLSDWWDFESIVLAMAETAHRFRVLIPVPLRDTPDGAERARRLAIAQRVVALEKPAHTVFDVAFYWALFRIGEARLGEDTLVDRGGRAPDLLAPMVLGRGHLAESRLAPSFPADTIERRVLGRDRLAATPTSREEHGP